MTVEADAAPLPLPTRPKLLGVRLSIMMFLQWAMFGLWAPLAGRFLEAAVKEGGPGFSSTEKGWILGISGTMGALLAPFLGGQIADRYIATEKLMAALLVVGAVLQWLTVQQTEFFHWMVLAVLFTTAYAPTMALSNSLAFAHMTDPSRQFPRIRVWGTIGWIVAGLAFSAAWLKTDLYLTWKPFFIDGAGHPQATARMLDSMRAGSILAVLYALYCLTLPTTPPRRDAREPLAFRRAFRLFARPSLAVLIPVSLLIAAIHNIYFMQTGPLLKHLGIGDPDIGPAMTVGQFAEIFMIAILGLLLKRLGFRVVMTIGAAGFMLRFLLMGTTSLPLWMIVGSLGLHGVCFACFYATAFIYVDRLASDDVRHSAQTALGLLLGLGPVLGGWLNGVLVRVCATEGKTLDHPRFWYAAAAVGGLATLIMLLFFRDETKQED